MSTVDMSTVGRGDGAATGVRGTVAEGFEPVRDAFARNFVTLGERGAAVAVYRDGRKVVDLWAGAADFDGGPETAPWRAETAQIVHSVTKGIAATVPLLLHQRGTLDLDAPVGTYWPEYKAAGKDRTLVRHLLAHRAGVPVLDRPLTPAEVLDPAAGPAAVAAQAPVWEPGTEHGYHALTYGWLLAELVRRVGGRGIGRCTAEELAGPLGLDLWIGLPPALAHRTGRIGPLEAAPSSSSSSSDALASARLRIRPKASIAEAYRDPASLTRRAFGAIDPRPDLNDPAYRAAELPASAGIATARSLARLYAAMLGEVHNDGAAAPTPRLFAPATLTLARTEESAGPDRVLVSPTRFGLGYMLHSAASPFLAPGSFGHPGSGGSLGFADPESGIAFGYVTNGMRRGITADPRPQALIRALRTALGQIVN